MKLYLDDYRPCPVGFVLAKNYDEAIRILYSGLVTYASLDHDLADIHCMHLDRILTKEEKEAIAREKTGYDVICWIEENDMWPEDGMNCHSANPVGKARIEQGIMRHYGRLGMLR